MSTFTIRQGDQIRVRPGELKNWAFDWDVLRPDVTISTSTWSVEVVKQNGATALTTSNDSIVTGDTELVDNRATRVQLVATTTEEGDLYTLVNTITTTESLPQTLKRSALVFVTTQEEG